MKNTPWIVAGILLILWLIGFAGHIAGIFIHVLLVLALIIVVYNLVTGNRATRTYAAVAVAVSDQLLRHATPVGPTGWTATAPAGVTRASMSAPRRAAPAMRLARRQSGCERSRAMCRAGGCWWWKTRPRCATCWSRP